jgi:hypothetical protein
MWHIQGRMALVHLAIHTKGVIYMNLNSVGVKDEDIEDGE